MACTTINRADVLAQYVRGAVRRIERARFATDSTSLAEFRKAITDLGEVATALEDIAAAAPDPDAGVEVGG